MMIGLLSLFVSFYAIYFSFKLTVVSKVSGDIFNTLDFLLTYNPDLNNYKNSQAIFLFRQNTLITLLNILAKKTNLDFKKLINKISKLAPLEDIFFENKDENLEQFREGLRDIYIEYQDIYLNQSFLDYLIPKNLVNYWCKLIIKFFKIDN